jgi:DNA-binding transcriptional LysR family regulator
MEQVDSRVALHLTLRQLQIFRAVAETGSTSAAAASIALSQSAASAAVNELERMLGMQLFDRVGKRLLLNDNGRALLPRALNVMDGVAGIERWAKAGPLQIGTFRIGASTTIGNYMLPPLFARFRDTLPAEARDRWDARVVIANTATIVDQVSALRLDLGLIEGPCHDANLVVERWLQDVMVIVAAPSHPMMKRAGKRRPTLSLQSLRQVSWLLRESGSGTRETVEQLLTPHLHHLRAAIEFSNTEAIKRAAACGLGFACISRYVVDDMLASGELVAPAVKLPRLQRTMYLVTHPDKHLSRGLNVLLEHLRAAKQQGIAAIGRLPP